MGWEQRDKSVAWLGFIEKRTEDKKLRSRNLSSCYAVVNINIKEFYLACVTA